MSLEALIQTGYNQPRARAILSCKYTDPTGMVRHYSGEGQPLITEPVENVRGILEIEMVDTLSDQGHRIVPDSIKFEYLAGS